MQQGMKRWATTGTFLGQVGAMLRLAEAYGFAHRPTEGLRPLNKALTVLQRTGERLYEAELYWLRRELLRQQAPGDSDEIRMTEIETCFLKAIAVAQDQQARLLKLRATISLSRLWIEHGQREEALAKLTPIYAWFSEGFDTPDLPAAKALLNE